MSAVKKLFKWKDPYDLSATNDLFVEAMRENAVFQYNHSNDYKRILDENHFDPQKILTMSDLASLPFIPTLYLKHHKLQSVSPKKQLIKATSSGTGGAKSSIGLDFASLKRGLNMVIRVSKYHHLLSAKPANYIIFGYEPSKNNQMAISKTAFGFTLFTPALSRTYALQKDSDGYTLCMDKICETLTKYSKSKFPLRTIGFPAYTYFLLKEMQSKGIHLKMPNGSLVALGGGWKQFYSQKTDKQNFYNLVYNVLGIREENVLEFFGAAEHPVLYTDCRCHHFHIPVYSRVIIRDADTFKPLPYGKTGLINLLTPMIHSMPLLSIMTDDIGVLHNDKCPCGISSPYLEIIGRVGINDIITCAAGAEKYLKENQ